MSQFTFWATHLTPRKYLIIYITVRRTNSIIPCCNASRNILYICFNSSEMTTCLTHDQINDKRKMQVLSEETFLESGKLFKKNFQSRSLNTCAASSTQCPNFRGLFTSKVTWNYTWNLKPKRWHQKQFGHLFFLRPHSVLRKGRGGGGEKEFEIYREGLGKALKELSNVCVSIFSPLERSANFITNTFSFAFHTISFIFLLTLAEKMI